MHQVNSFLEKTLEDIICDAPSQDLKKRGLDTRNALLYRQVNLGGYGIADIIGVNAPIKNPETGKRTIFIDVYELKQKKICVNALMQACRYVSGIENYIEQKFTLHNTDILFRIILIGNEIEEHGDFVFLCQSVPNLKCLTYNYFFDGIKFRDVGTYHMSEPRFPKQMNDIVSELHHLFYKRHTSQELDPSLPF